MENCVYETNITYDYLCNLLLFKYLAVYFNFSRCKNNKCLFPESDIHLLTLKQALTFCFEPGEVFIPYFKILL